MGKMYRHSFIVILLFFVLSMFLYLPAGLSTEIPKTPAGERIKESLDLIDSGDMNNIRNYISNQFTQSFLELFGEEKLFNVYYGFFEKYRGLEFHKAKESSPHKLVGYFRCRLTGSGYLFGLTVQPKKPHKIQGMTILPLAHPDEPESLASLSKEEKIQMLEYFMDSLGEAGVFSGAVLLAREGEVLFKKAYGQARREDNIPNRIDTQFNLASLNKMFTAVAVAQLCETGKMSYGDPIGKFLKDDWIPRDIGNKVQVKHLLSHTSGIGIGGEDDNQTYLEEAFKGKFRSIDDYKAFSSKAHLKFEPGSKFSYSNMGMHLLGPIIQKISGESYYQYLESHIFKPAGMSQTAFYEMYRPEPGMAMGYVKELKDGKVSWRDNSQACQLKGTPAGGAFATVKDLLKFERALHNNTLVSEKTKEMLFTAKTELNASSYGYGFSVRQFDKQHKVGHSGGYIGINNLFSMYLNNGYTVIILSNIDLISGSADSDIEFFITSLFF